jgi:hypothetical protein
VVLTLQVGEKATIAGYFGPLLSPVEADTEREIYLQFAPTLAPLLRQRESEIVAFRQQLAAEQARLRPLVVQLARFAEVRNSPLVKVFLMANADEHNGIGGYGGWAPGR